LHFRYTAQPISGGAGKSPGERALQLLLGDANYSKTDPKIFEKLTPKLNDASQNAKQLARENRQTGSDNPSTNVHELVTYLMGIKHG
jgi:hypothetical protein